MARWQQKVTLRLASKTRCLERILVVMPPVLLRLVEQHRNSGVQNDLGICTRTSTVTCPSRGCERFCMPMLATTVVPLFNVSADCGSDVVSSESVASCGRGSAIVETL